MSSKKTLDIPCKCGTIWHLPHSKGNVGSASFSFQCDSQPDGKHAGCGRYITIEMLNDELIDTSISFHRRT